MWSLLSLFMHPAPHFAAAQPPPPGLPVPPAPPALPAPPPPGARGACGLPWLPQGIDAYLSSGASLLCRGNPHIPETRYWDARTPPENQAEVVVIPATAEDVAKTVKFITTFAPSRYDWTFVSGGHSVNNGSTASGLIIDLQRLNSVEILKDYRLPDRGGVEPAVIAYGSGATWGQIDQATAGSGFVAVGARVRSVGAGGFTTGGGIGFLAGIRCLPLISKAVRANNAPQAYGYATDRVVQFEVVLLDGRIVLATKTNAFADLFWSLQGGKGQFGIVTKFWVRAVPEPSKAEVGIYWIKAEERQALRANVVHFFNTNTDPHSMVWWTHGFILPSLTETDVTKLGINEIVITLRFADPHNSSQPSYDQTFSPVLAGLSPSWNLTVTMPYERASETITASFPYGWRRLFQSGVVPSITVDYLSKVAARMDQYIAQSLAVGDVPASAAFNVQYLYPGCNGNLPSFEAGTAWPHSTVGRHQTLFSPAWLSAANDALAIAAGSDLNKLTYARSAEAGGPIPRDYPNYWSALSPEVSKDGGWDGSRYYGANLQRLVSIKEKYDPRCYLRKGPTFATAACRAGGYASIF